MSNNLFSSEILTALTVDADQWSTIPAPSFTESGKGEWPSWFAVTDLASASIGAAAGEVAQLVNRSKPPMVEVDRRLASMWFAWSLRPEGWQVPAPWDALAGNYQTNDGWIKLHTNAPHHRRAALAVLGCEATPEAVTAAVKNWSKVELEESIVTQGGCAAMMQTMAEWNAHPQGKAIAGEPLVHWHATEVAHQQKNLVSQTEEPLGGLRVLDLTRVLAGPVATRFLARFGAEVLRIDPPDWEEPGVVPEVTLGKRCAGLDLHNAADRRVFEALLKETDVLLHGYRPGALDNLGYSPAERRMLNFDLIDVSLSAYGWSGPWAGRRGFDSLVQMSCGIADFGRRQAQADQPTPLPVQALDHATGYLLAAAAVRAVRLRRDQGRAATVRLSLARTAALLISSARSESGEAFASESLNDRDDWLEQTAWGKANRLQFPVDIDVAQGWGHPAGALRTSEPRWQ